MKEIAQSPLATTVTLRVAEARVEDIGHAIARLAPADCGAWAPEPAPTSKACARRQRC